MLTPPLAGAVSGADQLLLRNLEVIRDRTVRSVTVDGARLDDGRLIGWDAIERGTVDDALQDEFDTLLKQVGEPLFRIRQRLTVGDYAGLRAPAEAVHAKFFSRASEAGYMVAQALTWARLADGDRELALVSHLECVAKLRAAPKLVDALPGRRRPAIDDDGLAAELPPIWFDAEACRRAEPQVLKIAAAMPTPRPPGVYMYCATLALTAGDTEMARRMLAALPGGGRHDQWRVLVQSQLELQSGGAGPNCVRLPATVPALNAADRPVGLYWQGRAQLASDQAESGMLSLLRIPAAYGAAQPDLAAAALHACMLALEQRQQVAEAVAVRRELLEHYARTSIAKAVRSAPAGASPPSAP